MHFWDRHKTITCYYEILMASVCEKYDLRKLEYDILLFLYHNPKYHTAADIVRIRKSTKSHVSTALKVLEEKGFITIAGRVSRKYYEEKFYGMAQGVRTSSHTPVAVAK